MAGHQPPPGEGPGQVKTTTIIVIIVILIILMMVVVIIMLMSKQLCFDVITPLFQVYEELGQMLSPALGFSHFYEGSQFFFA